MSLPDGGTLGIASTLLTFTPPDALADVYLVNYRGCDNGLDPACDDTTWTITYNDAPTSVFSGPIEWLITAGNLTVPLASIANLGNEALSVTLQVSADGTTFSAGPITTAAGNECSVSGTSIVIANPAAAESDTCHVRVCETCGAGEGHCVNVAVTVVFDVCFDTATAPTLDSGCTLATAPACDETASPNFCEECTAAGDCTGHVDGEMCDPVTFTCVECIDHTDCTVAPFDRCTDAGVCVECLDSTECTNPADAVCDINGDCTPCQVGSATDCLDNAAGDECLAGNVCGCVDETDCEVGETCNTGTNLCEAGGGG